MRLNMCQWCNMDRSDSIGALGTALAKAQLAIRGALKTSVNPHFQSRYADLATVHEVCREPLATHGLALLQIPSADGNLIRMVTMLIHGPSGEWLLSDPLQVQARDAAPQAVGSCISYLRRYQLAALVGIAPADDDGEAAEGRSRSTGPGNRAIPREDATGTTISTVAEAQVAVSGLGAANGHVPAPPGAWLIESYTYNEPWHEFTVLNYDSQGGALKLSTKLKGVGESAHDAWLHQTPVILDYTPKKNRPGEAYVNSVTTATGAPMDDIPF